MFCQILPRVQINVSDIYSAFQQAPQIFWDTQIRFDSIYAIPKLRNKKPIELLKMEEILCKPIRSTDTKERTQTTEILSDKLNS